MSQSYPKELEIAQKAVHRASIITKDVMRGIRSFDKTDATPVTIADYAAQALIICAINHHFPGDDFIAEESSDKLRQDSAALDQVWNLVASASKVETGLPLPSNKDEMLKYIDLGCTDAGPKPGRIWILDPVDGTRAFMKSQQYAVCLCLTVDGEQKVAALGCPNLKPGTKRVDEHFTDKEGYGVIVYAVAGEGAFVATQTQEAIGEAEPVKRPPVKKPKSPVDFEPLVATESAKSAHADIPWHREVCHNLGVKLEPTTIWAQQMKYIGLAFGAADAMIRMPRQLAYRACVWDHAGGQLIYQEAGGKITDMYGNKFQFGQSRRFVDNCGYIAADPEYHEAFEREVKKALEQRAAQLSGQTDAPH